MCGCVCEREKQNSTLDKFWLNKNKLGYNFFNTLLNKYNNPDSPHASTTSIKIENSVISNPDMLAMMHLINELTFKFGTSSTVGTCLEKISFLIAERCIRTA